MEVTEIEVFMCFGGWGEGATVDIWSYGSGCHSYNDRIYSMVKDIFLWSLLPGSLLGLGENRFIVIHVLYVMCM